MNKKVPAKNKMSFCRHFKKIRGAKMKNAIYKICEKLHGYSCDEEYFEILQVEAKDNNEYKILVKAIKSENEEKKNEK